MNWTLSLLGLVQAPGWSFPRDESCRRPLLYRQSGSKPSSSRSRVGSRSTACERWPGRLQREGKGGSQQLAVPRSGVSPTYGLSLFLTKGHKIRGEKFSADRLPEKLRTKSPVCSLPRREGQLVVVLPRMAKLGSISNGNWHCLGCLVKHLGCEMKVFAAAVRGLRALRHFEALGQTQELHGSTNGIY